MSSKIWIVGLGPGLHEHMTPAAQDALKNAEVVVGYKTYIDLIKFFLRDKEVYASGMRKEVDRCKEVLEIAKQGKSVALVSSGDAGVYGMAGIMLELVENEQADVDVVVVPGVSAANAAAATLGAPLMHDYCVISLSDLLTDWEVIKKRIACAGEGDFVIALYNPRSKGRPNNIVEARDILLKYRSPQTPVGIVTNAKRENETMVISDLQNMCDEEINMFSMVIIGNSKTYVTEDGTKMITPRGYQL